MSEDSTRIDAIVATDRPAPERAPAEVIAIHAERRSGCTYLSPGPADTLAGREIAWLDRAERRSASRPWHGVDGAKKQKSSPTPRGDEVVAVSLSPTFQTILSRRDPQVDPLDLNGRPRFTPQRSRRSAILDRARAAVAETYGRWGHPL